VNRHCCVAKTHALGHKHLMRTRRLEKLISIQDWTNLDKVKNYEMCESRAEIKQDDIEVF
jgi:hypothetical protein